MKNLHNPKEYSNFAHANGKQNGSLDEWLSQRSAKPRTAVRIRQEPRRASHNWEALFFFVYVLLKNIGIVGKIFITERKIHLNRK